MPLKKKLTLYRVKLRDPIGRKHNYQYHTGHAPAYREQLKQYRRTGKWDDVEMLEFDFSKKGVCRLLNNLKQ